MLEEWMVTLLLVSSTAFILAGRQKWAYGISGVLAILWLALQKAHPPAPLFMKATLVGAAWVFMIALSQALRKTHLKTVLDLDAQIRQKKEKIRALDTSDAVIQEETNVLEKSLAQKEALYESLKELNKTLEFTKTVEVFSNLASRLTSFEEGSLVIAFPENGNHPGSFLFQLVRNEAPILKKGNPQDLLSPVHQEMLSLCAKSSSLIFINNPASDSRLARKEMRAGAPTLLRMGLFHKGMLLGNLVLEGCKKRELETLEILTIQLNMEIEKAFLYEKVKTLSIVDGLTQTYLRRQVLALLEDELSRLGRQQKACSVLMIDIDHFKSFNDNFGHLVGDILLKELSFQLQEILRPMDLVGRYGGEEFLIALPETTCDEAREIAERIRSDVQTRNFFIHEKLFKLTVSIGLAAFPEDATDLKSLIEMADEALYQAKGSGRNQVRLYSQQKNLL